MPLHNFARPQGSIVEIEIASKALSNNLLGDPTTRSVAVYLPPGHDESEETYPLFVDMVGFTGSGLSHTGWKAFWESVPVRLERLAADGKMGPVVAAFPDCFTSLGGNQYINSSVMGNWEDFLIDEMIPAIESQFKVRKGREHRACFGKSSGGYGAIAHGLRRADAWNAVACHSGDMMFELVYRSDFPNTLNALSKHDHNIETFIRHLQAANKIDFKEMHALMILAMAATYDPDPSAPFGVRLPVDLKTCELDEERWAAWLAHDPIHLADRPECQANLRRLAGVFIECGWKDQYHLHYGSRVLTRKLKAAGIEHTYEEFDDNHSGVDYRMDVSLPFLYRALTA